MNNFAIELFKSGLKANFYTIHFEEKELSETDKFLSFFVSEQQETVQIIVQEIKFMLDKRGAAYEFFRPEGDNFLIALPKAKNKELRLYCIWVNREIVILGNGGVKNTKTYQNDPKLDKIAKNLKKINKLFEEKIENEEIWIENMELKGNLIFKPEEDE